MSPMPTLMEHGLLRPHRQHLYGGNTPNVLACGTWSMAMNVGQWMEPADECVPMSAWQACTTRTAPPPLACASFFGRRRDYTIRGWLPHVCVVGPGRRGEAARGALGGVRHEGPVDRRDPHTFPTPLGTHTEAAREADGTGGTERRCSARGSCARGASARGLSWPPHECPRLGRRAGGAARRGGGPWREEGRRRSGSVAARQHHAAAAKQHRAAAGHRHPVHVGLCASWPCDLGGRVVSKRFCTRLVPLRRTGEGVRARP